MELSRNSSQNLEEGDPEPVPSTEINGQDPVPPTQTNDLDPVAPPPPQTNDVDPVPPTLINDPVPKPDNSGGNDEGLEEDGSEGTAQISDTGASEGTSEDPNDDDWESLPKMSHQSVKHTTAAGFGEIFNTTTKPIYSKMDLNRLVSVVGSGGALPPQHILQLDGTNSSLTASQKYEQFEKIYGKLKKVDKEVRASGGDGRISNVIDPLSETLQSNFLKTIVKTCLYRLLLIGSHKEDQEKLIEWMKDVVEDINVHSYSETLTGVFLMYPNHFIHVLEGSEDTLMKYIRAVADQFEPTGLDWKLEIRAGHVSVRRPIIFNTVRAVVVGLFQIKHRGIPNGWKAERTGPGLTMNADQVPQGDFRERLFQFTRTSIIMAIALYKLNPLRSPAETSLGPTSATLKKARNNPQQTPSERSSSIATSTPSSAGSVVGLSAPPPNVIISATAAKDMNDARIRFEEQKRRRATSIAQIVPKPAMIDYIMRKNDKRKIQLRTVREHIEYFWRIPNVIFSQQTDWPIPEKIAPYD